MAKGKPASKKPPKGKFPFPPKGGDDKPPADPKKFFGGAKKGK